MSELTVPNRQFVGAHAGRVGVMFPVANMTGDEARVHAAWLVAVADIVDPAGPSFDEIREAVRLT
jgi:hypothetical protein